MIDRSWSESQLIRPIREHDPYSRYASVPIFSRTTESKKDEQRLLARMLIVGFSFVIVLCFAVWWLRVSRNILNVLTFDIP